MTREDIRRENARALAAEVGGPAEFARVMDMEPAQVNHIIGKNPIRNIGNSLAPRIEDRFGRKRGWLDQNHSEEDPDSAEAAELVRIYKALTPHARATVMTVAKSLSGISLPEQS